MAARAGNCVDAPPTCNAVERMVVVDMDGVLDVDDLPSELVDPSDLEVAANAEQAADGWAKVFAFLRTHLGE